MPSPFYTPGADIYGGAIQARREAQNDFASRLGQLYAGGNQQAGQTLGGIAPDKLDAIRSALEKMPATEQAKAKQRVDMLKKWIYSISQTQDEPTRALLWNQMIAQAHQSGADVSNISPNYSAEALEVAKNGLMSIDELMSTQRESRLVDQAQKEGISAQERDFLAFGDASSTQWQDLFSKRYAPKIAQNGAVQTQLIPDETLNKAIRAGIVIPLDWVNDEQAKRVRAAQGLPVVSDDAAAAAPTPAGGIAGSSVTQVMGQKTPEQLQIEREQRDESRRLAEEGREAEKVKKLKQEQTAKDLDAATVFYRTTIDKFEELKKIVSGMNPLSAVYSDDLTKARSIVGRLLTDIKNPKMADLGAITPSDLALLAGFVPDLSGASLQRFVPSQAVIPLEQGIQYVKDKAAGFYASKGAQNPFAGGGEQPAAAPSKPIAAGHPADIQAILDQYRRK